MHLRNEYFFLSNMYPCEIKYNGHTFQNSEAAFQAQKDLSRVSEFENIDGKSAKRLGRKVKIRKDWEDVKLDIMEEILRVKFSNKELAKKLKNVKKTIVEDNTWNDTYWGVCNGVGQNNLGKILEKIKKEMLTEKEKTIVVLGGSFNPPTKAHTKLLESAVKQTNASFGLFVPSSNNYVARKIKKQNGSNKIYLENDRKLMLDAICTNHKTLRVDTCEFGDDGKGHTYDTLCKIQAKYPDYKIMFIVGADKIYQLPRWHNSKEFFNKFEFVYVRRNDINVENVIKKDTILSTYKHIFHEINVEDVEDISSTKAREFIKENNIEKLKNIVDSEIIKYL